MRPHRFFHRDSSNGPARVALLSEPAVPPHEPSARRGTAAISAVSGTPVAPAKLTVPTIKGIFVNSHIRAVRKELGRQGLASLENRCGMPLRFDDWQDVPVAAELALIEAALELLDPEAAEGSMREYEAGRLHFRDFATTPWARLVFGMFPRNFAYMMKHATSIGERVFKGVAIESEFVGEKTVRIRLRNSGYPINHFRGLIQEWMDHLNIAGSVQALKGGGNVNEYIVEWR